MTGKTFYFKTYYYLPSRLVMVIPLIGGGIALIATSHLIFGIIALALAPLVFTTHYGIAINTTEKIYVDYLSVLGMRSGKEMPYDEIEYLFVKASRESQTMNSQVTSRTDVYDVFDGYLKFNDDEKIYLLSDKKKAFVMKRMNEIGEKLGVGVVDYTLA